MVHLAVHLKARFDEDLVSAHEPYHSTLNLLAEFDLAAAKGVQVRSWIRWVDEGETSSSYFCRLEKKRSVDGRSLLFRTLAAVLYLTRMTCVILSLPFTRIFSLLPLWTPLLNSLPFLICLLNILGIRPTYVRVT